MGRAHEKGIADAVICVAKKIGNSCITCVGMGQYYYQINNSTAENQKFGQYNYTYLVLIKEDFSP